MFTRRSFQSANRGGDDMTLEEAIRHCEEVAEENDLAAGTYEILAENNHNAYEKLTAETNSSRCAECASDHRQLAEWLTELKEARQLLQLVRDDMEFMMSPDKCRVCGRKICTDNTVCRWRYQERLEKYFSGNVE